MTTGIGIDLTVVDSGRESDKRGTQRHGLLQKIVYLFIYYSFKFGFLFVLFVGLWQRVQAVHVYVNE